MNVINVHDSHLLTLDVTNLFNGNHWDGNCESYLDDTIYMKTTLECDKGKKEVIIQGITWAPREASQTRYEKLLSTAQAAILVATCVLSPKDVKRDIKTKIEDVRRLAAQGVATPIVIFLMQCHQTAERLVTLEDVQSVVKGVGGKEIPIYEMYGPDWVSTALKIREEVLQSFHKQHVFDSFIHDDSNKGKQGRCAIS